MEPVRRRVPPTFQLPDLAAVDGVDAAVPAPATAGTSVVVDTADLALARWGVRLSHDATAWQLVLPPHPGGLHAAPTHHTLRTSARTIPAAARRALARLAGDEELTRVARLEVRREGTGLVADGVLQVHVSDEEVSVHTGRRLTGRFREVVLQQAPGADPDVVAAVAAALHDAGALEADEVPRAVRVLGPAAGATPDLPEVPAGEDADAAWRGALVGGLHDLLVTDVHLRLDDRGRSAAAAVDVVDRVTGLVDLLDGDPSVATGLARLRGLVDEVDRHAQQVAVLGDDLPGLRARGDDALGDALRALHGHQDSDEHAATLAGLRRLAAAPGLTDDEATAGARASVAGRVGKRWAPLAGALTADEPHAAATLAALAAGAAVAPGKAPRRFAHAARAAARAARDHARARRVQTWLADQAADLPPAEAFRAGHLAGRRAGDAAAAREAWATAVERLTAGKARKWLS